MAMRETFTKFSAVSASLLGSPWMFVANVMLILVWLFSGPFFHYSDTWQLVVNTATTVITYLAVFLIQNTQNRDATAVHLKLDELITSLEGARNRFAGLQDVSDEELEILTRQFKELREKANAGDVDAVQGIADEIDELVPEPEQEKPNDER